MVEECGEDGLSHLRCRCEVMQSKQAYMEERISALEDATGEMGQRLDFFYGAPEGEALE